MYQTIYRAAEPPQWVETTATIFGLIFIFSILALWIAFMVYYFLKQYKKDLERRDTDTKAMNEMYKYFKTINDINEKIKDTEEQEENGQ